MNRPLIVSLSLLLAACAAPQQPQPTQAPVQPSEAPAATATVETPTEPAGPSFTPAVYVDGLGRYQISYPADWQVDDAQGGSRGSYIQITSWQHEGAISEIPEGESVLQIAVYLWDPKHDLNARVDMRRTALEASGNVILEEEQVTLPSGQPAVRMLVQDTAGQQSVFLFAELGEDYVELSSYGPAVELFDEMLATFTING